MSDLLALANMESEDEELLPEILPVDARLALRGPKDVFIALFERAVNVVPKKEISPGTEYALLEGFAAEVNTVAYSQITATDGEQTLAVVAEGIQVIMAGGALLPPKRVLDVLKLAPEEQVRLEILGSSLIVRSGRAQWTIQTPLGDSLPPLPDTSSIVLHDIQRKPFLDALQAVRIAASTSSSRSSLMQLQVRSNALTAGDGARVFRWGVAELPADLEMTIPVRSADELIRALRLSKATHIRMGENDRHMVFQIEQDILIAQRMILPFPDMKLLLLGPKMSNTQRLTVPRNDLIDVVKRVRVSADPEYAGVYLLLTPGKKVGDETPWNLTVRARDKIGNTAQESMVVDWDGSGKPRELCLNHSHLLDLLSTAPADVTVTLALGEDTKSRRSPVYIECFQFEATLNQMTGAMLK